MTTPDPARARQRETKTLELIGLTRRYPGVLALDDVSFDLVPGEVHALVGENGAGKSTLIRIASGVIKPDVGSMRLGGEEVSWADPVAARRAGIVTVHQEAELFATLSAAENMALFFGLPRTRWGGVDWRSVYRSAQEAVDSLGRPLDVRALAARLSVAERHLLQVAAAMMRRARVVIFDEPTSSLSAAESRWLFEHIAWLKARGVGIVYVSHRQEEIFALADRITVLRDGRRVWSGPAESTDPGELIAAMVGRPPRAARARRTRAAVRQPSAATERRPPRLEVRRLTDAHGACHAVTLDVAAGEIVGIYGLVGAGRSEWAQTLFGLRPSRGGEVKLDGRSLPLGRPRTSVQAGLCYLPEDRLRESICPLLAVRENAVLASLARWSLGPWVVRAREQAACGAQFDRLAVRYRTLEQPIGELSGGNQQKVVLARWLMTEPRVLVLDEPTRGIDVAAKAEIHRLLDELAARGAAVILISSELTEVLEHTDRVLVFREGRVAGSFDPQTTSAEEVAAAALPVALADRREGDIAAVPVRKGKIAAARTQVGLARPRSGWRIPRAVSHWGLAAAIGVLVALILATGENFHAHGSLGGFAREAALWFAAVLTNASVWIILALAAAAVIAAGGIDISIGALVALAAAAAALVLKAPYPVAVSVPTAALAAMAVGMAGGLVNAGVALAGRVHPIVVTLGTMTIFRGLVITLTGSEALTDLPPQLDTLANVRYVGLSGATWLAAAVALAAYAWLHRAPGGRHLLAWGASPSAARLAGISHRRVWLTAFGGGGLLAGIAALVELAQTGSMQAVMGSGYELRAIAAAVIGGTAISGGRTSVPGVVLGALLLSLLYNALVMWGVSQHQERLFVGALIVTAVLFDLVWQRLSR